MLTLLANRPLPAIVIWGSLALAACDPAGGRPAVDGGPSDGGPPLRDGIAADGLTGDGGGFDATGPDASSWADAGVDDARFDEVRGWLSSSSADAAALDTVIQDIAWAEGWPLRGRDRLLFATRWEDAPSGVAVVADPNGWATTRNPATRAASGVHYYAVVPIAELDAPYDGGDLRGAKYKWWGQGDVYRAPPEATAYDYDEFGQFGYVAAPSDRAYTERFPLMASTHLGPPRTLRARIPAGFVARSAAAARARAILFHDGQNVFDADAPFGSWQAGDALAAPDYADVIGLAVDNAADRFDAYTHVADNLAEIGGTAGGRANDYLALLRDEALPFFREHYGIVASGDSLVIAGSSLGGLVSLWIAMTDEDLAGCVIAMSPTLGWGAYGSADGSNTLLEMWPGAVGHGTVTLYMDHGGDVRGTCTDGDGDGVFEDADDSDNYCATLQFRDRMLDLGYRSEEDLFHWWEPGAGHNEAAWAARLPMALTACAASAWTSPTP